jgi:hypothetical protein
MSRKETETRIDEALAVLEDALDRCRQEDMRTPEVFAALDFLAEHAKEKRPFDQFRDALNSDGTEGWQIEGRWQVLNASLNGIKLALTPSTVNRSESSGKRREWVFEPPSRPKKKS